MSRHSAARADARAADRVRHDAPPWLEAVFLEIPARKILVKGFVFSAADGAGDRVVK